MSFQARSLFITVVMIVTEANGTVAHEFTGIAGGENGDVFSQAFAVNANGDKVVGNIEVGGANLAFVWTLPDELQILDNSRVGRGVSGNGHVVVGSAINPLSNVTEPMRWTQENGVQLLGGPPGVVLDGHTGAYDVNFDGSVIVGQTQIDAYVKAFRWTAESGVTVLDGLGGPYDHSGAIAISDDGNVIVGVLHQRLSNSIGFRWDSAHGITLIENPISNFDSGATNVSPDGNVVIGEARAQNNMGMFIGNQAFRWTEQMGMTFLQNTIGGLSTAFGVTQSGEAIVGTASVQAFVWTESRGMERLDAVLSDRYGLGPELSGWQLFEARDISADGRTIVGSGLNPEGHQQAWLVRLDRPIFVPEPTSMALALLATGVGLLRYGRRATS